MKKHFCLYLCLVMVIPVLRGEDWELFYPDDYPATEELPFLSIGSRGAIYMIGSRSGHVLIDYFDSSTDEGTFPFSSERRRQVKLPLPFDIHAVSSVNGQWILGGPRGQFAIHKELPSKVSQDQKALSDVDFDHLRRIQDGWELHRLPTEWTVEKFAVHDEVILAVSIQEEGLADTQLKRKYEMYRSDDKGVTWAAISEFLQVFDVAVFKGVFFALAVDEVGPRPYMSGPLGLFRSTNGKDWETIWEFDPPGISVRDTHLMVLDTGLSSDLGPAGRNQEIQLFVQFKLNNFELTVSSPDGVTWFNNGSTQRVPRNLSGPWNPLDLPDSEFVIPQPDWEETEQTSGMHRISKHQVEAYRDQQWRSGIASYEEIPISPETVSIWDELVFVQGLSRVLSITDSRISSFAPPDFADGILAVQQLIAAGGTYYAVVRTDELPFYRLGSTTDFKNWEELLSPEISNSFRIFTNGNTIGSFFAPYYATMDYAVIGVSVWDDRWTDPIITGKTPDVTYVPSTGFSYALSTRNAYGGGLRQVVVQQLVEGNQESWSVRFIPDVWNGSYNQLTCPDGENLVAFGDSAEVAFIQTDGTVLLSHPRQFFSLSEYQIDSVDFVNGWYYLLGGVAIRTRDFMDYEVMDLPSDLPLTRVVGFGDYLYGFVSGAVYRRPMEKGYLDSIIRNQGWRQSDWLGWFLIQDEGAGAIDHLLLGECWVKGMGEDTYWIRTSALGWIWMNKDWAPWLYRLDDGHWYWLDQKGWPPRAWDDAEKEWVALRQ